MWSLGASLSKWEALQAATLPGAEALRLDQDLSRPGSSPNVAIKPVDDPLQAVDLVLALGEYVRLARIPHKLGFYAQHL